MIIRVPAVVWSLIVACVAAATGCGGGAGSGNTIDGGGPPGSDAKAITAFSFLAANNPALAADISATIAGHAIAATVPAGTDVTALIATFSTTGVSVTIAGTAQISGTTANDFSNPVTYRIAAGDGSFQDYVATLSAARVVPKSISEYRFLAANNAGLAADITARINGTSITATVPSGTRVTALVATFATTGASVSVGGIAQVSDATANDFTAPVIYRIAAADGSTQDYTVVITVAPRAAKAITDFRFLAVNNAGLGRDVVATINGTAIAATVPSGTDVSALVATFSTTGTIVRVAGTAQVSGATANNFGTAVTYQVTAADGTIQSYAATVAVAARSAKAITSYQFLSADNPGLGANITATINGTSIAARVPAGTPITELAATFSTTGTSVTIAGAPQISGTTVNDFAATVTYHVTAADGSAQDYTVTVTLVPRSSKAILELGFLSTNNPALRADVRATISGASIVATVPSGTDLTALIATFATTGARVSVANAAQVSGTTANNFATPVTYRVTAADGSAQDYIVTVTAAPAAAKAITDFGFLSENNPALPASIVATITGTAIAATVPSGTDVTALVATFSTTGTSVAIGTVVQISGTTANSFARPVSYRVTAGNGTTQDYTVTISVAPRSANAITQFGFLSANNTGLGANVAATISGTSIAAVVPATTDLTALVATFSTTGSRVTVAGAAQFSGTTTNDFRNPVTYRVTAADGSTQDYTVTVTLLPATAKVITDYSFLSASNPGLSSNANATITGTAIAVTVPTGTNVTALVATFHANSLSITVGNAPQVSATTTNDFSGPVIYHLTAADGSSQDYTVTVTVAPRSAKAITDFRFLAAGNPSLTADAIGTIDGTSINVVVSGADIGPLIATFSTTGANVSVATVTQISGTTANSFATPVIYRVTAADSSTLSYTVTVTVSPRAGKDITDYRFRVADNPSLSADAIAVFQNGGSDGLFFVAHVPVATNLTSLIATFTTTGTSITIGGVPQISGTTPNNFTNTVHYRVTAANGTTQDYAVIVVVP